MRSGIVSRICAFMENEARSCSMDFGCVTPLYVYRMWGGMVAIEDISIALESVKKEIWQ
jgi:hypothetical protein